MVRRAFGLGLVLACAAGCDDTGGGDADVGPFCGDGLVQTETGEVCDGEDLGGATCLSLGHGGGVLRCGVGCAYAVAACEPAASCGDGAIDDGEVCDGDDLGGATCATLGYHGGALACDSE